MKRTPKEETSGEKGSAPTANAPQTVPLICSQCGGRLSVERRRISSSAHTASVLSGQRIVCPYCRTEFLPGDQIGQVRESISIVGNGVVVGKGSSSTVTIFTGDRRHSQSDQQKDR